MGRIDGGERWGGEREREGERSGGEVGRRDGEERWGGEGEGERWGGEMGERGGKERERGREMERGGGKLYY